MFQFWELVPLLSKWLYWYTLMNRLQQPVRRILGRSSRRIRRLFFPNPATVLPPVLDSPLLVDGVGNLPLVCIGVQKQHPGMIPILLSFIVPILLSRLILVDPSVWTNRKASVAYMLPAACTKSVL